MTWRISNNLLTAERGRGGGCCWRGITPLYGLYGYVPWDRVGFWGSWSSSKVSLLPLFAWCSQWLWSLDRVHGKLKDDSIHIDCRFNSSRPFQAIHSPRGQKNVVFNWGSCIVWEFNCTSVINIDRVNTKLSVMVSAQKQFKRHDWLN